MSNSKPDPPTSKTRLAEAEALIKLIRVDMNESDFTARFIPHWKARLSAFIEHRDPTYAPTPSETVSAPAAERVPLRYGKPFTGIHRGISRGGFHCTDNDCSCHLYQYPRAELKAFAGRGPDDAEFGSAEWRRDNPPSAIDEWNADVEQAKATGGEMPNDPQ